MLRPPKFLAQALAVAALAVPARALAGKKTDVIVLVNGDRLTGDIKGLARARLDFNTDDAGRLSIEWDKVVSATSIYPFEIETSNGKKYFSKLMPEPGGGIGFLHLEDGKDLPIIDVVSIVPLSDAFVRRLKAYLDLGFTLAKANTAATLTMDGELAYRGERLGAAIDFDVYSQNTDSTVTVSRDSLLLSGDLYFNLWAVQLFTGVEHNDELDLKLRLTLGSGVAYWVVRNNSMEFQAKAGLAGLREQYVSGEPTYYLTSYASAAWEAFQYDSPKLDTGITVTAFPYLTDPGRVRLETTARVKYEIFTDFNVGLSISDTFDSRPPDTAASNNDYLMTVTIGWSYRR